MFRAKSILEKDFKKCPLGLKNEAKQSHKETSELKLELNDQK
jgi:hypothetical protein